jgi:hypothetical protein
VAVDGDDIVISPINMGSVYQWNTVTMDDIRLVNKYEKFAFDQKPLTLDANLKSPDGQVSLTVHNHHETEAVIDTLHWDMPEGWTMTPAETPVEIAPGEEHMYSFTANYSGALYPVPRAHMSFPFKDGHKVAAQTWLQVARTTGCVKAAMPPTIDGNIAEPIWDNPETVFFDDAGTAAETDPVAFYFAYDEKNLYIAAKCLEPMMDSLRFSTTDRDGPVYGDDCVGLFIQPNMKEDIAYQIYFNPMGTIFDQKLTRRESGYMFADMAWDGDFTAMAVHGDDFWTLEAAIPLTQFGTSGYPGKKIGLNFRRKQQHTRNNADWQVPIDYDPKSFGIMTLK